MFRFRMQTAFQVNLLPFSIAFIKLVYIYKRRKSSKLQKYPIKDVGGARDTKCVMHTDGQNDTQKDKGHFYSPFPPTSSDKQEE